MKKTLMLVLWLLVSAQGALAGQETGHGGGAWICGKQEGDPLVEDIPIAWIEVADLSSARIQWKLEIDKKRYAHKSYRRILSEVLKRLKEADPKAFAVVGPLSMSIADDIDSLVETGKSKGGLVEFVPNMGVILDLAPNTMSYHGQPSRPGLRECFGHSPVLATLASFDDDDRHCYKNGKIVEPVWKHGKFTEINKAALVLHEAMYAYYHALYGYEFSSKVRYRVALLFSTLPIDLVKKGFGFVGFRVGSIK